MKLKSLIMASALAALGAATVVPPPIAAYEAQATKKKKAKKKSKKRTGNRNRSRSSAATRVRNSGQNSRNQARQARRNAADRPARQLMALPPGSRTGVRLSDTRARYPGRRAADPSPTREPRSRSGEASRMETSSVGSISTVSTVLTRQPMPEN